MLNKIFKNKKIQVDSIFSNKKSISELIEYSKRKDEIEIDLENQKILYGNNSLKFELDEFKKKCLLEGLDDIGLTLNKTSHIDKFEKQNQSKKVWL